MKRVLITGASRGIGEGIAKRLSAEGAYVVGTATKKPELDHGYINQWIEADFSCNESLEHYCNCLSGLEGFDICINNAGINIIKPLEDVSSIDYFRIQKINLESPYLISRALLNGMKSRGGGKIINISSIWGCVTKKHRSLYSTMKTGIVGMTRALAVELAPCNILVNAVSPGFTMTDLTKNSLSVEQINSLTKDIPLGRFAEVDEIASIVTFLASEQNTYLTGQNIIVDGGFTTI